MNIIPRTFGQIEETMRTASISTIERVVAQAHPGSLHTFTVTLRKEPGGKRPYHAVYETANPNGRPGENYHTETRAYAFPERAHARFIQYVNGLIQRNLYNIHVEFSLFATPLFQEETQ